MQHFCELFQEASETDLRDAINTFVQVLEIVPVSISIVENGGTWNGFLIYGLLV